MSQDKLPKKSRFSLPFFQVSSGAGSHILFGIIIVMMSGILNLLLISMLLDSKIWSFDTNNLFFALLMTCVVCGFELYIKTFTRTCDLESKSN